MSLFMGVALFICYLIHSVVFEDAQSDWASGLYHRKYILPNRLRAQIDSSDHFNR